MISIFCNKVTGKWADIKLGRKKNRLIYCNAAPRICKQNSYLLHQKKTERGEICFPDLLLNAAAAAVLWLRPSATCGGNTITELYLFALVYTFSNFTSFVIENYVCVYVC